MNKNVLESFEQLNQYIEKEQFMGYDPYDTLLSSWVPFKKMGKWPSAIATQIQKRNPINIRSILGINKEINPKAFGLFLQAYSILYKKTKHKIYLEKANYFFDWLISNYTKGYSGMAWGYNFPWSSPVKYMDAHIPSAVVTGFIVKGMIEYESISSRKKEIKRVLESAALFLDNDLEKVFFDHGVSISYTPIQRDVCYNASLLAAESLAKIHALYGNIAYREIAISATNFVISKQHEDGQWNYSLNEKTLEERVQIDFHQGYVLESIYEIQCCLNVNDKKWDLAIKNGLNYYVTEQFHPSGKSFWRIPKLLPVEIHNQTQGIICLSKMQHIHSDAINMKHKIMKWTIDNMQGSDGHFYYQVKKYFTIKISYMRWSNAWMFLAFAHFFNTQR